MKLLLNVKGCGFISNKQERKTLQWNFTNDPSLARRYSSKRRALNAFGAVVRDIDSDWVRSNYEFVEVEE